MIESLARALRLLRAAALLLRLARLLPKKARDGLPFWARRFTRARAVSQKETEKLTEKLQRMGPSAVKMGQFLATRPDIIGADLAGGLESLQDRAPPFPIAEARASLERELEAPMDSIFEEFSDPVAAASIAQVHRARAARGKGGGGGGGADLAVKLLRPAIEERFQRDLSDFARIARRLERTAEGRRLRFSEALRRISRNARVEMDLRLEAAAIEEVRDRQEARALDERLILPKVDWRRTARRVLTTTWVEGSPLGDLETLDARRHDRPYLARSLTRIFLLQALHDGFFHADMHRGNLFVTEAGRIAAVDFGIMGHLSREERFFIAEILMGFLEKDYRRAARAHFAAGYVPSTQDEAVFAQALRAIVTPVRDKRAKDISMGRLLTQLFEVTALFEMETQPQLLLLQKTMLAVEGLARRLDPALDSWEAAETVVEAFLRREESPSARLEEAFRQGARLAALMPPLLDAAEAALSRGGGGEEAAPPPHGGARGGRRFWAGILLGLLIGAGAGRGRGALLSRAQPLAPKAYPSPRQRDIIPPMSELAGKNILLIIGGGIAAYKSLDLARQIRRAGGSVHCVLTRDAERFVTPLSAEALSGNPVHRDLFALERDAGMAHIALSRRADIIIVAPATASLMARMAQGLADDLASATLLASNQAILLAPAMNAFMWSAPATKRNVALLKKDGRLFVGPEKGETACGEMGVGRMSEPAAIIEAARAFFEGKAQDSQRLSGLKALVTSGPTREALDPVRYISNRSSGKQGHAIAAALAGMGADTLLVSGPCGAAVPEGVRLERVETGAEMHEACRRALPVDVAVCAAAICDWRPKTLESDKIKKNGGKAPEIRLEETTDILAALSHEGETRPRLVVGFAAETQNLLKYAAEKRRRKGCDWILANDVSPEKGALEGEENEVHLIREGERASWSRMSKKNVALRLGEEIALHFERLAPAVRRG